MKRKLLILCMVMLLMFTCAHTAFAEELEGGKIGSLTVTLTTPTHQEPMVGAELSLYYVATVGRDADGRLHYAYTSDFAPVDLPLDDARLVDALDTYVAQKGVAALTQVTDDRGTAVWGELALGLYFVKQTENVEGFSPCTSFLVTIPNEGADGYVYEVNATPKTEIVKLIPITIRKVWNVDAATKIPTSVTVQLLHKGNVVKTAVLNAQNNWQVVYADMPESDEYSIKEVDVPQGFTATYRHSGYVFTVTNSSTLIQTGQLVWPIPVLAVSGMLLIAVGVALLQKKRKTNA